MPELPEVETIVRGLNRFKPTEAVSRVLVRLGKVFKSGGIKKKLLKRKLAEISRRGKFILIRLDDGQCLVVHLGMTGQLYWTSRKHQVDRHTHFRLEFAGSDRTLNFRDVRKFGQVQIYDSEKALWSSEKMKKLGPDALQISRGDFSELLQRRRMIKVLLLDQKAIAGIGNIYADESLFAAKIHPARRANEISPAKVKKLYEAVWRILRQAIAAGGSSIRDYRQSDGQKGMFQTKHKVYGRTGLKCRWCGKKIERLIVAGRSSHICPACQRLDS